MNLKELIKPAALTAILILIFLIVPPNFSFPVDDDWAYIQSVQNFLGGHYVISDYIAASTILHTFIGFLYSRIFGFSIPKIHLLAAMFSLLGILGVYYHLKWNYQKTSIYTPLIVFLNPIYFFLSYSFGTDVLFTALAIWSVAFYKKGIDKKAASSKDILAGSLFSAFAILTRQIGIFLPLSAAFYLLARNQSPPQKSSLRNYTLIFLLPSLATVIYFAWFNLIQPPTLAQQWQKDLISINLEHIINRIGFTMFHLGLFLLPLSIFSFKKDRKFITKSVMVLIVAILFALWMWVEYRSLMIYKSNIFTVNGFHPNLIQGYKEYIIEHPLLLGTLMTAVSAAGAAILFGHVKKKYLFELETIIAVLLISFFFFTDIFYARYFIPTFALLAVGLFGKLDLSKKVEKTAAVSFCIFLAFLNLFGIFEFREWNQVRWRLGKELLQEGIPPEEIDGGYEWNFWFLAEKYKHLAILAKKESGFRQHQPRYVITFPSPEVSRYKVYKKARYELPFLEERETVIYVIDRDNPSK